MIYNTDQILNFNKKDKKLFKIYQSHGHGVMESPYKEGKTIKTIECTEFEAWIVAEALNIEINGFISDRSSWEDPTIRYKEIVIQGA